jgi:hypothetical protein
VIKDQRALCEKEMRNVKKKDEKCVKKEDEKNVNFFLTEDMSGVLKEKHLESEDHQNSLNTKMLLSHSPISIPLH